MLLSDPEPSVGQVQVKSSTRFANGSWVAAITKTRRGATGQRRRMAYTAEEIDYFAIVNP